MEVAKEMRADQKQPQAEIFLEAEKIIQFAEERKITLRLLGGVGVWFVAPSASKIAYARRYNDIDLVGYRRQSGQIEKLFIDLGYRPREIFNKLQGDTRLMFFNEKNDRRIDIFLDKFVMCHEFNLKDRLELSERSLTPADLLLTKLQIVEINKKDILDVVALLVDIPISDKHSEIDRERIISFTSSDWGIYKTVSVNLEKIRTILPELALPAADSELILERIDELVKTIKERSKTFGWKMRAKVGDKVKWYELPESV
ncbi:MAG: hypothetical protein JRN20_01730 [Nitrososphaerota archaeon]|nr:hypothetical protein [Nitrososphaerota archaeon]